MEKPMENYPGFPEYDPYYWAKAFIIVACFLLYLGRSVGTYVKIGHCAHNWVRL